MAWVVAVLETPPGMLKGPGGTEAVDGEPCTAVTERCADIFGEDVEDLENKARSLLQTEHRPSPIGLYVSQTPQAIPISNSIPGSGATG